ncbi:hypothetical protein LO763_16640 [Glycomyces sp. A-F 0318]|uniref:hypothetical protein n=1 Tax=Glycomyces amatae TaxID=2881355 RepID=UPI001E496FA7|nr:hypothetical protein [Glycomyces amatae]MCD0445244.1 hypothetical protein [Glycomyces amatae]
MIMFPNQRVVPAPAAAAPPMPMSKYGPGTDAADATAKELEDLASREEFAGRARQLRSLAGALRDPDEARGWRDMPLHAVFANLPLDPGPRTRGRVLQGLYILRAAVVFLPLLVSWWGIHGAVDAYRRQLDADADLGAQSFFRDWLSGFDGELMLSFDRMAFTVVVCILVLIAVSAAVEWCQRLEHDRDARSEADLRDRVDAALTEAGLHLNAAPRATGEEAERQLAEMVAHSADLIEALVDTVRSVQADLAALADSTGEFRAVVAGLDGGAREIAAATDRLGATVGAEQSKAAQVFQDAGAAVARDIAEVAADLRTGLADQQTEAADVLRRVGDLVIEAVGQGERHRDAVGRLLRDNREEDARALAEAIAERQTELADELRRAGEAIAAKLSDTVQVDVDPRLKHQLDAVEHSNLQLHAALDGLARSVQYLGDHIGQSPGLLPAVVPPKRGWFGIKRER